MLRHASRACHGTEELVFPWVGHCCSAVHCSLPCSPRSECVARGVLYIVNYIQSTTTLLGCSVWHWAVLVAPTSGIPSLLLLALLLSLFLSLLLLALLLLSPAAGEPSKHAKASEGDARCPVAAEDSPLEVAAAAEGYSEEGGDPVVRAEALVAGTKAALVRHRAALEASKKAVVEAKARHAAERKQYKSPSKVRESDVHSEWVVGRGGEQAGVKWIVSMAAQRAAVLWFEALS